MQEEIIKFITDAEKRAQDCRAEAQAEADKILSDAEKRARAALQNGETECAMLRENILKAARKKAEDDYASAIAEAERKSKEYCDGLSGSVEGFADEIVERIVG